jgi:GTPase SAR1 family protein
MRVAITGTHGIGKTTLIEDFVDQHRNYEGAQARLELEVPLCEVIAASYPPKNVWVKRMSV